MGVTLTADELQDSLAVSLARAVAAANKRARALGIDVLRSVVTITQRALDGSVVWRINYGPRECVGRRGGDLVIDVDPDTATVKQVLKGQ